MNVQAEELVALATPLLGKLRLGHDEASAATVAAALRTKSGKIHTGVCLDLSSGIGFCAEHAAVAEMLKHRETDIEMIVAVSETGVLAPCGRCRELLWQVSSFNSATLVVLPGNRLLRLAELLPEHWLAPANG